MPLIPPKRARARCGGSAAAEMCFGPPIIVCSKLSNCALVSQKALQRREASVAANIRTLVTPMGPTPRQIARLWSRKIWVCTTFDCHAEQSQPRSFFPEAFIDEISILVVGDFFASASAACAPRVVREHTPLRGRRGHGGAWQWPLGARVAGVVGTGQHWA